MPPELLLRTFRFTLVQPTSAKDENLWLRREQLTNLALVCRLWTSIAISELRGEPRVSKSTAYKQVLKRLAESKTLRRTVQRWSIKESCRRGNGHITRHRLLDHALPKFENLTELSYEGGSVDFNQLAKLRHLTILRLRSSVIGVGYSAGAEDESFALPKLSHLTLLDILGGRWHIPPWAKIFTLERLPALTSVSVGRSASTEDTVLLRKMWQKLSQSRIPITSITIHDCELLAILTASDSWARFTHLQHLSINCNPAALTKTLPHIPHPLRTLTIMPEFPRIGLRETFCIWSKTLGLLSTSLAEQKPTANSALERLTVHVDGDHPQARSCSCNHECADCQKGRLRFVALEEQCAERGVELVRVCGAEGRQGGPQEEWWNRRPGA